MGFEPVYDYVAGKKDWGSFGLSREGTQTEVPCAGDVARHDVPTCRLDERLQDVRARARRAGWDTAIVVTDTGVVLGRLGRAALRREDDVPAEDAMTEGPTTVRPSIGVDALLKRMAKRNNRTALITTPDGRLVGIVRKEEAEARLSARSRDAAE